MFGTLCVSVWERESKDPLVCDELIGHGVHGSFCVCMPACIVNNAVCAQNGIIQVYLSV